MADETRWCGLRGKEVAVTECVASCPAPEQKAVCIMEGELHDAAIEERLNEQRYYRYDVTPGLAPFYYLSPRQQEYIVLIAHGWLQKQIAAEWGVSLRSVKDTAIATYRKLGVHTNIQAIRALGWLTVPPDVIHSERTPETLRRSLPST